jgi:hypothetical protein
VLWLLTNVWWLVPLLIGGLALANLPMTLAVIRRVPVRVWLALAAVALLGLTFQSGRWYERRAQESAQEAAEKRADAKAGRVAKQAHDDAEKATAVIRDRTEDVADEVEREMDGARVCPEPVQPERVRELGEQAVEAARRALQAG